jgi:nucleoside-diphosphate-sugar epimerase
MTVKALDASEIQRLGWRPAVSFHEGLDRTYRWFLSHKMQSVESIA